MKKQLLFALTLLVGQICFAGQSKTKTCDNNVSQVFKNVFIELPGFREIQGGSKIVVIRQFCSYGDARGVRICSQTMGRGPTHDSSHQNRCES